MGQRENPEFSGLKMALRVSTPPAAKCVLKTKKPGTFKGTGLNSDVTEQKGGPYILLLARRKYSCFATKH